MSFTISSDDHAAIADSGMSEEKELQPLIGNAAKMTPPLMVRINRLRRKLVGGFVIMISPALCCSAWLTYLRPAE